MVRYGLTAKVRVHEKRCVTHLNHKDILGLYCAKLALCRKLTHTGYIYPMWVNVSQFLRGYIYVTD